MRADTASITTPAKPERNLAVTTAIVPVTTAIAQSKKKWKYVWESKKRRKKWKYVWESKKTSKKKWKYVWESKKTSKKNEKKTKKKWKKTKKKRKKNETKSSFFTILDFSKIG